MATENFTLVLYFVVYTDQQNRPDEEVSKVSKMFFSFSLYSYASRKNDKR